MIGNVGVEMLVVWGLSGLGVYHLLLPLLRTRRSRPAYRPTDRWDSSEQLRDVMAASFSAKKVMSFSEYKVFKAAEEEVQAFRGGYRVFSQTALGEVLQSADKRAHSAINSKRVDVLIISPSGYPAIAVEYQGAGHYQNDAAARDAVKKEALRKAGIDYIEILDSHTLDDTRRLVRSALMRRNAGQPATPSPKKTATA